MTRNHPSRWIMFEGLVMYNVHDWETCQGVNGEYPRACVIHRPTLHHMRLWPLRWRNDRGIFERACQHGIGHPDPDQFDFWRESGRMGEAVHGCDGCCTPPLVEQEALWATRPGRATSTATTARDVRSGGLEFAPSVASPDRLRVA